MEPNNYWLTRSDGVADNKSPHSPEFLHLNYWQIHRFTAFTSGKCVCEGKGRGTCSQCNLKEIDTCGYVSNDNIQENTSHFYFLLSGWPEVLWWSAWWHYDLLGRCATWFLSLTFCFYLICKCECEIVSVFA